MRGEWLCVSMRSKGASKECGPAATPEAVRGGAGFPERGYAAPGIRHSSRARRTRGAGERFAVGDVAWANAKCANTLAESAVLDGGLCSSDAARCHWCVSDELSAVSTCLRRVPRFELHAPQRRAAYGCDVGPHGNSRVCDGCERPRFDLGFCYHRAGRTSCVRSG